MVHGGRVAATIVSLLVMGGLASGTYPFVGPAVAAAVMVPVVVVALQWGAAAGLGASLLLVPVNLVLLGALGVDLGATLTQTAPAMLASVAVGGVVGWLRDDRERIAAQLAGKRVAEQIVLLDHATAAVGMGLAELDESGALTGGNAALDRMVSRWPTPRAWWRVVRATGALPEAATCHRCQKPEWRFTRVVELVEPSGLRRVFELTGTGHAHPTSEGEESHVMLVSDVTARSDGEVLLAAARDEALAASQAQSAFLANMTQELRTPLNAILGYSELIREQSEESNDPWFVEDIDRIQSAGRQLLSLITDVNDLSKIEGGRLEVEVQPFAVSQMVRELEATAQALASVNQNTLHLRCAEQVGAMVSDPAKVAQVVTCLLSNACKFTERGQITLSVWREGEHVVFVVADTGIGLEPADLEHVFSDFWQADRSPARRRGGGGMGLAISRRLARLLGGEVTVRSRKGEGSTFMARFAAEMPAIPPTTDSQALH